MGFFDKVLGKKTDKSEASAKIWVDKSIILADGHNYVDALKGYDKAIEMEPSFMPAWNNKGNALFNQGRYDEAIKCYDEAIRLDPKYVNAWNNKGNALKKQGKYEVALKAFDKAIEIDPKDELACNNKCLVLISMDKIDEAIDYYKKSRKAVPDLLIKKLNSLIDLGKYDEAIKFYEKVTEIERNYKTSPWYAKAWSYKSENLINLNKYDEAIKSFSNQEHPMYAVAWKNKGDALQRKGLDSDAICCYEKAIDINPNYFGAWNNKCNSLMMLNSYDEVINYCIIVEKEFSGDLYVRKENPRCKKIEYRRVRLAHVVALLMSREYSKASSEFHFIRDLFQDSYTYDRVPMDEPYAYDFIPKIIKPTECRGSNQIEEKNGPDLNQESVRALKFWNEIYDQYNIYSKEDEAYYDDFIIKTHNPELNQISDCLKFALEYDINVACWNRIGRALITLTLHEAAIKCYDKITDVDHENVNAWHNKAYAFSMLGRFKQAIECYDQVIAIGLPYHR